MINYKIDSHIHTNCSPDADQTAHFQAYIEQAKKLGLGRLIFTDHVDFDAVHPLFYKQIDYDKYIQDFKEVKKESEIDISLGVEIGYQPQVTNTIKDFLAKYPFEHVILSIHYIDNKDLYTKEYFEGKSEYEYMYRYFEILLEAVTKIDRFDVVGHFDYITRYSDKLDYEYEEYSDIIDKILLKVIEKNKGIEINTSGYETDHRMYPKAEVIKRYIELGGTKISIGSDAHRISELGRFFDKVKEDLSE